MDLLPDHPSESAVCAGVDEVGRGPLAGPVVTAAVILDPDRPIAGLKDSKKLTHIQRERLFVEIHACARAVSVGRAEAAEIDEMNILSATLLAMQRAVAGLSIVPDVVYVDGNVTPPFGIPAVAIIGGDGLHEAISAASIVAKVVRDREMVEYAAHYPEYGFERHKGYASAVHLAALEALGPTPIHRRSFAPLRETLAAPALSLFDPP